MARTHEDPQPQELGTGERLGMTSRAVINAIRHELRGEHETVQGRRYTVPLQEVERIIAD